MTTPPLILNIDASSLKESDCSFKFKLANIDGLTSRIQDHKMEWGSAFHKYAAVRMQTGDDNIARQAGLEYWMNSNCHEGPGVENDFRNVTLLNKAMVAYSQEYKDDRFTAARVTSSDGSIVHAVELPFKLPFIIDSEVSVMLCGVVDALGHYVGGADREEIIFKDIKTTSTNPQYVGKYFESYNLSIQMMLYSWIIRELGFTKNNVLPKCMIDGVFLQRPGKVEFIRSAPIQFDESIVEEMMAWIREKCVEMIERVKKNNFTKNFSKCHGQFGACQFLKVCSVQEGYREGVISANYVKRVYDPAKFGQQQTGE